MSRRGAFPSTETILEVIFAGLVVAFGFLVFTAYRNPTKPFDPAEVRRMSDGTSVRMNRNCHLVDATTGATLDRDNINESYEHTRWASLCRRYWSERPNHPRLMPREKQ